MDDDEPQLELHFVTAGVILFLACVGLAHILKLIFS